MFSKSKKLISMLMTFVIVFSYMGETLQAVATTDALSAITNGFFKTGEMQFNSYFSNGDGSSKENILDVNQKTTMFFEVAPSDIGQGFLKEGKIVASSLDGSEANFKFLSIKNVQIDEPEVVEDSEETAENEIIEENTTEVEDIIENEVTEENEAEVEDVIENEVTEENEAEVEDVIENEVVEEDVVETEEIIENEVTEENAVEVEDVIENESSESNLVIQEVVSRSSESRADEVSYITTEENGEELIDENQMIEALVDETYEELTAKDFEIELVSDNEIKVQNVIYRTVIEVEIEYNAKEKFEIADLYKENNLQLKGTYINIDLEKIETEANETLVVGWSYNKDFEISGEYTQFSPFELGENKGIIVENKIKVKREIEDENYFPVKQTKVEIEVPEYNGNLPETVNIQSTKLMATKGEDLGNVSFNNENWTYSAEDKKIVITVNNENEGTAVKSAGEDEYIVIYRYNNYTEDEKVAMENNFKVTVEEYSSNSNRVTTKDFNDSQEVKAKRNDLITYNVGSTEEKLNIAKINANYNSEESIYETEFTTTVNVNVLTSDLLEELKINSSKEMYVDANSAEYDATTDIYYNKVKFSYNEIKNMLDNGASIEIQNIAGEVLHTLNSESVNGEDSCEVRIENKEKALIVVFKNITLNGNVSVEFTKAIGKSNYDKATFNTFESIKSYVSTELKYKDSDEKITMDESFAVKELQNSKTVAEITLSNKNLTTTAKNEGVEVRISLNNDKQDTDLYINPSFELVFPKYVKNVTVESINLINKCDLQIADYQIYIQDDIVKMKINLVGIQRTFSENILTDGTNILLNLNIELDEYTPKKQDQIKMYYCNEGVTNYESQTKWTIAKEIPQGIIKQTNGFDVAVVNYQAPQGLITANAIINYDGQASKISSVNEGEKTVEISENKASQIATMELVAMNNTENPCTDVVFMGRIPFASNKSVVTNNDLGTNVTVKMLGEIKENIQNVNMTTIYYSTNENATKDLNNAENAWTTNVINWQNIKSYMIVVKGEVAPGAVFKYTYDFEIPETLGYEKAIYGSFGGFYNNNLKSEVRYESTEADKVGLTTIIDPVTIPKASTSQIGVEFEVSKEGDLKIGEGYSYYIELANNSEVDLENAILELNLNEKIDYKYSRVDRIEKKDIQNTESEESGDYVIAIDAEKYQEKPEIKEDESAQYNLPEHKITYTLDTFKAGERITISADVRGVLENEDVNVYAILTSENLEENVTTETITTKFYDMNFAIEEVPGNQEQLVEGNEVNLKYKIRNTSEDQIDELVVAGQISDYIEDLEIYLCGEATGWGDRYASIVENKYNRRIMYLYPGEEVEMTITGKIKNGTADQMFTALIEVYTDEVISAGHSFSYGIQAGVLPVAQVSEETVNEEVAVENYNVEEEKYSLSGSVYIEAEETNEYVLEENIIPSEVKVQLLQGSTVVGSTTTDASGSYKFENLESGDYSVMFDYDEDKYASATKISNNIEVEDGLAVSDTISITNASVTNVNSCLQEKERFDFNMKQYITKAIVDVNGEQTEYAYEDLDLAKLEIKPQDIDDAIVKFEYKLVIENIGNVEGQVESIVDYVPNGLTFNEKDNNGWSKGVNGNVYTDLLKDVNILPGEEVALTLVLSKKMTEDNTGVISNKAQIAYTESATRITEAKENNFASQETIVTLTQGGIFLSTTTVTIFTISIITIVGVFGYMIQSGKIEISFKNNKGIKKVYK